MLTADASSHDGLTLLADQQLAGLIMWIPMDLFLFAVAMALFAAALSTAASRGSSALDKSLDCEH
jgi:cytochrome c oxidase assembly factor CtaG